MKKHYVPLFIIMTVFNVSLSLSASATEQNVKVIDNVKYCLINGEDGSYYSVNDWFVDETKAENTKEIVIVDQIDSIPVKKISANLSYGEEGYDRADNSKYSTVRNIVIPETVEEIGAYAFSYFSGITELKLPDSLELIGKGAFSNMKNLKSVVIPKKVKLLSGYAFYNCENLSSVKYEGKNVKIAAYAFRNCTSLKTHNFADSIASIGVGAFKNSGLTKVSIPGNVEIEQAAFGYCTKLKSITITKSTGDKVSLGFSPYSFADCIALEKVYILDENSEKIFVSSEAFRNCTYLKDIYFFGSEELWKKFSDGFSKKKNENFLSADVNYYYKHSHSFTRTGKNATCVKTGKYTFSCVCGDKYTVKLSKNDNHSFNAWKTTKKATTNKDGLQKRSCKLCGKEETRKLRHVSGLKVSVSNITYGPDNLSAKIVVKDGKKKLVAGKDYTVTFKNNTKIGRAEAVLKGNSKRGYTGKTCVTYEVLPAAPKIKTEKTTDTTVSFSWQKVAGATGYRVYVMNKETRKYEKLKDTIKTSYTVENLPKPEFGTALPHYYAFKAYTVVNGKKYLSKDFYKVTVYTYS